MLTALDTKYGPFLGAAIGVAGGVWILRELHTDSLIIRIAAFSAALASGLIGGYLMKFLDADPASAKPDAAAQAPRGDDERGE